MSSLDYLETYQGDISIELAYSCRNCIEFLAAACELLITHGWRLLECPSCGRLFVPVKSNQKHCSSQCSKDSQRKSQLNYQSKDVIRAYNRARSRIAKPSSKGQFSADSFCATSHPLHATISAIIKSNSPYASSELNEALAKLKDENLERMADRSDPFNEVDMISWLDGIKVIPTKKK